MRGFWTLASCIETPGTGGADAGASLDGGASDASDGGAMCSNGFECCSGFCQQGVCIDVNRVSCVGVGGSCTTSGDCCNAGMVQCNGGQCVAHFVP
jgi:hypothetical protein